MKAQVTVLNEIKNLNGEVKNLTKQFLNAHSSENKPMNLVYRSLVPQPLSS